MADPVRRTLTGLVTLAICAVTVMATVALVYPAAPAGGELANRIPEAPPYVTSEAALIGRPSRSTGRRPIIRRSARTATSGSLTSGRDR